MNDRRKSKFTCGLHGVRGIEFSAARLLEHHTGFQAFGFLRTPQGFRETSSSGAGVAGYTATGLSAYGIWATLVAQKYARKRSWWLDSVRFMITFKFSINNRK